MNRRLRMLFVIFIAGFTVVLGTGGVSSITATHNADVTTTADRDAYLGFEQTTDGQTGSTAVELTVVNQQSFETDFSAVEVIHNGTTVDIVDGTLEPGEAVTHSLFSVSCEKPMSIHASGAEVSVRMTRPVDC